jgi:Fe-S cluster assembly iron-binding protein IscA
MALDEPRDSDETFAVNGFTFLVNKDFLEKVKPIKVDFTGYGFKVDCAFQFSAGGGCAGCGSAGTCH